MSNDCPKSDTYIEVQKTLKDYSLRNTFFKFSNELAFHKTQANITKQLFVCVSLVGNFIAT